MVDGTRVCHVVNTAQGSSIPVDIALAQNEYSDVSATMCPWFSLDSAGVNSNLGVHRRVTEATTRRDKFSLLRVIVAEADIVHAHSNHAGFFGKLAARLEGVPVISTEHNDHGGFTRNGRIANGITNPLCATVTCVSRAAWDSFMRWERALMRGTNRKVIYNGVDRDRIEAAAATDWPMREELGIRDEAIVVGNAAALVEQKNQQTLIEAVSLANERAEQPIELVLSGDGPLREPLERAAEAHQIADSIHFLGYLPERSDVYAMIRNCDLFAMPSLWEGFCVAVLEAMALSIPCILSDIAVFEEIYGDAAEFHSPRDATGLADELVTLATDGSQRDALVRAGASIVEEFPLEETAAQYVAVYRDALRD